MHRYNPRSEVYHLCIYTDKEVVFIHNSDFTPLPPPFFEAYFEYMKSLKFLLSGRDVMVHLIRLQFFGDIAWKPLWVILCF